MRRLLCLLFAIIFVTGLSGCFQPLDKDGMVYEEPPEIQVFSIGKEDVSNTGYYGMQFLYDDREPSYTEKITVTVYFKRRNDLDTDWAVYVTDHEIPFFNENYIKYEEPDLYNEGNMEIVSGQWIYVRCDPADSATSSKGSFDASYFAGTGNIISYSPDEEYKRFLDNVSMYPFPENPNYYLADITGDGVEERCNSFIWGSGMVRTVTAVYDMRNHKGYCLNGYNYDYRIAGVDNGRLIVEETGPNGYGDPTTRVTGTVGIVDGQLTFVPDT